jgi:hypothetical protein
MPSMTAPAGMPLIGTARASDEELPLPNSTS